MQATTPEFKRLATSDVRPIRADVFFDFTKNYIPSRQGLQDWDKYDYVNYSNRLVSVEWEREESPYASISSAIADIVLDNHDGLFTPNGSSPLRNYILPGRPLKIYSGFGSEVIQSFVGATDGMPSIDENNRLVTFHALDWFSTILKTLLDESTIFVGKRTDEILRSIFNEIGILDVQMNLDIGFNTIPYFATEKGDILADVAYKLMEAESGRLFMDEFGVITFKNRQHYSQDIKMYLDKYRNIVSTTPLGKNELINSISIRGKIREVQSMQPYAQLTMPVQIPGNNVLTDIWIDFQDPVTSAVAPVYISFATTSYFETNSEQDGSGSISTQVFIDSSTLFGTSMKLTFRNADPLPQWITNIVIFATPAVVKQDFYVHEADLNSVDINGEKLLELNNDCFGNITEAESKALIILHTFSKSGELNELEIKSDPSLQLGDAVFIDLNGVRDIYRILKITNKISSPAKFTQLIKIGRIINANYFSINLSAIAGSDMIAP